MIVIFGPDGRVECVAHPVQDGGILQALGQVVETRRAGHVVPAQRWKRLAFRLARALGLAQWTRSWRGPWVVHVRGTTLGPFPHRHQAIAAEELVIAQHTRR